MIVQRREVPLDVIARESPYRHSFPLRSELLERALSTVGMLNPVLVIPEGDQFIAISGFRRLEAARQLGWKTVPVSFAEAGRSALELFLLGVWDNLSFRSFNDFEKATVVSKLIQFGAAREQLGEICAVIGWPADEAGLKLARDIANLPEPKQRCLLGGAIGVWSVSRLLRQPDAVAEIWFELLVELRLGTNRQRELINLLEELSFLDAALDVAKEAQRLCHESRHLAPNDRATRLVRALTRRRYPRLSEYEERFAGLKRQLSLPRPVDLAAPPFFEEDQLRVEFRFRSAEELSGICRELASAAARPEMKQILELCRGRVSAQLQNL